MYLKFGFVIILLATKLSICAPADQNVTAENLADYKEMMRDLKNSSKGDDLNFFTTMLRDLILIHGLGKRSLPDPRKPSSSSRKASSIAFEEKAVLGIDRKTPCLGLMCGRPLMITPLIDSGKLEEAIKLAEVPKNSSLAFIKSYSGFFTINGATNTHMFFWFFPAMDETYAPVVIRLQGGPGESALFDIFNGIGPYRLDEKLKVSQNDQTLAKTANLLYFDNPIGTGFSSTSSNNEYPANQEEVAEHLYSAIIQFMKLFPEHKDNHVYISGEGYGAKYALSLAKKIHDLKTDTTINMKGIILGSPFLDPETIFNANRFLFEMGILDEAEFNTLIDLLKAAKSKADTKNFSDAMDIVEQIYGSPYRKPVDKKYYIPHITGIGSQYSILDVEDPIGYDRYISFVNQSHVRKALHVGNLPFQSGRLAYNALRDDILQSSKNDLSTILDHYRTLIYNGNFDKKTPPSLMTEVLENVDWRHLEEFRNNEKMLWKLNLDDHINLPDGYIRKARHFFHLLVIGSGHLVASDKPVAAYDAINRFIWGRSYDTLKYSI